MSPGSPFVSPLATYTTAARTRTITTLVARPDPSVCGRKMIFTATVAALPAHADVPSGTVMFSADGGPVTAVTLTDGVATFAAPLGAGTHTVTAGYTGDTRFHPAPLTTLTIRLWRTGF